MSAFGGKADIAAKLLTGDEARRIAANIANLPAIRRGECDDSKRGAPQAIALGLCFGLAAHQNSRLS
jgi:hypothetical protein